MTHKELVTGARPYWSAHSNAMTMTLNGNVLLFVRALLKMHYLLFCSLWRHSLHILLFCSLWRRSLHRHVSRDCHSRLAGERQTTPSPFQKPSTAVEPVTQTQTLGPAIVKTEKRQVTCFTCHQKGHKSPQYPQKVSQVRRVQIPSNKMVDLKDN